MQYQPRYLLKQNQFIVVAALFLVASMFMVFLGYGSDYDIYKQLDAGISTWVEGVPSTSRNPGYWLHEGIIFTLNKFGGFLVINIATLCVSLLVLHRFWLMASEAQIEWRLPITLCLAWNPWYLIASTSSIDYIWALLFVVISIDFFRSGRPYSSGIAGGLAVGLRMGSLFTITGALILFTVTKLSMKKVKYLLIGITALIIVGFFFYIPSWLVAEKNFTFLQPHLGSNELWTLKMHLGRVLYKSIYLTGVLTTVFIIMIIASRYYQFLKLLIDRRGIVRISIGAIIGTFALYVRYPIEHSYLLPALPFIFIIIGILLNGARPWLPWALVISCVSFWFISFPLAEPDVEGQASDASIGISVEEGVLIEDIRKRIHLLGCNSVACYLKVMESLNYKS